MEVVPPRSEILGALSGYPVHLMEMPTFKPTTHHVAAKLLDRDGDVGHACAGFTRGSLAPSDSNSVWLLLGIIAASTQQGKGSD